MTDCPLCHPQSERVLWRDQDCRVILVDDPAYPGFCRVIWNTHVREMTDLPPAARAHCMQVVYAAEETLRALLEPAKINLASLGNQVPHVHWHVIPRYADDAHYPDPVWAAPRRPLSSVRRVDAGALTAGLAARLGEPRG